MVKMKIVFPFQYDNFLVNLIKFITDLKETEQRIQLGEEQLVALNDNLNISSWRKSADKKLTSSQFILASFSWIFSFSGEKTES